MSSQKLKITIMGSSSSPGTPAAGGFWGACDPKEPKNHRSRASIFVQSATTNIIVDTSYDLRLQMNAHLIQKIDGVLISHAHSDHINGFDDMRIVAYHNKKAIDVYSNAETIAKLDYLWPHAFKDTSGGIYKGFAKMIEIAAGKAFTVGDIDILPFNQDHGTCTSFGFRFGKIAYSIDVLDLDETALEALAGVDVWIVDGGSYHKSDSELVTHANLARVFKWVERLKPKMTYITDLSNQMDYSTLCKELPPHIRPAYDGMIINI